MNKVGAYWLGQRANKEISSAGDDIEVRGTKLSHPCSFLLLVMFRQSSFGRSVAQLGLPYCVL